MNGILIAGGYGVVGRRITADLSPDYPVIVAGRHGERAKATADAVGHGAHGREIDVTSEASIAAAFEGVSAVVSCIDQAGRKLLHAAIERGLMYTDITPHLVELGRASAYEEICAAARKSGARIVLGTGIVPGISNVIVRALADAVGGASVIETSLLLSAGDASGPASFDYFLQELTMPFKVHRDGADERAQAFSEPRLIRFPSPFGPGSAYLFPFSDQVLYPLTLGAQTAVTRLALEPPWIAPVLATLVRIGAARLLAQEHLRHALANRRSDRASSRDAGFALRVDVGHDGRSAHATLSGGAQADAAAAGASATVRALMESAVSKPGAWMPEQVISPPRFFSHLAKHRLIVDLARTDSIPV